MNLNTAITLLQQHRLSYAPDLNPKLAEAHALGIKALEEKLERQKRGEK